MASARPWIAELLGTALLLAGVVGSGIMAERLCAGNTAVALLANTAATVGILYVLIEIMGPVSGAHFNPAVTLVMAARGELAWHVCATYVMAQCLGALLGVWLAHGMFGLPLLQTAIKVRSGAGQWLAEVVATAGLLVTVLRAPPAKASALVAAYIGAAYWFTASTSFANPAAVLGRALSNTFAGIAPHDAPGFVAAELVGAAVGFAVARLLADNPRDRR